MKAALAPALALMAAGALAPAQVDVSFDPASGLYQVSEKQTGYRLAGSLAQPATWYSTTSHKEGHRTVHELSFRWNPGTAVQGTIRWYEGGTTVWFSLRYLAPAKGSGYVFPDFMSLPDKLHPFSYRDTTFAPPRFKLNATSTPWLFFDDRGASFILSPASNFLIAKMVGDGVTFAGVGMNNGLAKVPRGFSEDSLLAFGTGIGRAWDVWGEALRTAYHRKMPEETKDTLLSKFGYWTDNGADYYYNYDLARGYLPTLFELRERYDAEKIPLGYLQLDSWWYQKTINDANGKPGNPTKNSKLPAASWNRYGGTFLYEAAPELFPHGLEGFQDQLDLPLAVHARWIDPTSPYHARYRFSGVGAVDPSWWNHVASYLRSSGVVCYEQDWLDHIYEFSPEMSSQVGVADAFSDGMAEACRRHGMEMQYCMATPRFFLQGVKYDNLTTIRTSDDRFERSRWHNFLFTSQLATEVGIRPWCDVFKSAETGNMILSVLSAGPVGTGDRMGAEDAQNIFRAIRPDGTIIRPDRPLVPIDKSYLDEASGRNTPIIAATETQTGGLKTTYVFAFTRSHGDSALRFQPLDVGSSGRAYLYDFVTDTGRFVDSSSEIRSSLPPDGYGYWMLAPTSKAGVVLLGDLSKIVPTGKQRIVGLEDLPGALRVHLALSAAETSVVLTGISPTKPVVTGAGTLLNWDAATGRFRIQATGPVVAIGTRL